MIPKKYIDKIIRLYVERILPLHIAFLVHAFFNRVRKVQWYRKLHTDFRCAENSLSV